jgi:hypothetical protein
VTDNQPYSVFSFEEKRLEKCIELVEVIEDRFGIELDRQEFSAWVLEYYLATNEGEAEILTEIKEDFLIKVGPLHVHSKSSSKMTSLPQWASVFRSIAAPIAFLLLSIAALLVTVSLVFASPRMLSG